MGGSITRAIDTLARKAAPTADELAARKAFLEFTASDVERLRDIHEHVEALHVADVFADLFYTTCASFPSCASSFRTTPPSTGSRRSRPTISSG